MMKDNFFQSIPGQLIHPFFFFEIFRALCRCIQLSGLTHFLPNEGRGTLRGALFGWTHTDKFADIIDKAGLVHKCSVLCLAWAALNVTKASIREVRAVVAESIVDSRFRSQTLSTLLLLDRVLTTVPVALPLIVAYLATRTVLSSPRSVGSSASHLAWGPKMPRKASLRESACCGDNRSPWVTPSKYHHSRCLESCSNLAFLIR